MDPSGRGSETPSQTPPPPAAVTNPAGCIVGAYGAAALSEAGLIVSAAGIVLIAASAGIEVGTLGIGTPVGLAGFGAGALLEGIAFTAELTAWITLSKTCIEPEERR